MLLHGSIVVGAWMKLKLSITRNKTPSKLVWIDSTAEENKQDKREDGRDILTMSLFKYKTFKLVDTMLFFRTRKQCLKCDYNSRSESC